MSVEVWAPLGAVLVAVVAYLGGRAQADASVAKAWSEFLAPLRDELADARKRLEKAAEENAALRRLLSEQSVRAAADSAAIRTTLAAGGMPVPAVDVPLPEGRTRATDHHHPAE